MLKKLLFLAALCLLLCSGLALAEDEITLGQWSGSLTCPTCRSATVPQYSNESHWYYCAKCDKRLSRYCHSDDCLNKGVCVTCGMTNVLMDTTSHGTWKTGYDGQSHYDACDRCGERRDTQSHTVDCATGTCTVCGASNLAYKHNFMYGSNKTHHWGVCRTCGYNAPSEMHVVSCLYPNQCTICPAAGAGLAVEAQHRFDYRSFIYNSHSHAPTCADCGAWGEWERHAAWCYDPTTCADCWREDSECVLLHDVSCYKYENALFDRLICQEGQPLVPHYIGGGICSQCLSWLAESYGDTNMDGAVDKTDLLLLAQYIAGWTVPNFIYSFADLNSDASVNMKDLQILCQYLTVK